MFVFGVDFFLGDVVQLSDRYGNEGRSRITEIVFSHDSEGEKTYPTFISVDEENEDGDKEE